MQPEEYIPVLISGAAVQLTFGLKKFLIGFFPVINIIQKAYSVSGDDKILEGHVRVDNQSINISWDNFIADYKDYTDSENVGLHEMAHAISYDFLYGYQENRNAAFNTRFKEYVQEAAPVFKELRQGKIDLLDDYGSLNVEEFWAVSIETFFENPQEFKAKMPGFYAAMSKVLNQDPMRPEKITDPDLAGLAN
jgi:Mlc titration factor MtfA (ptsG expression regulator)